MEERRILYESDRAVEKNLRDIMKEQEFSVGKLSELKDGEMTQVSAGGTEVVLARVNDTCYAVGAYCTHYDAPLVDGALVATR